MELNWIEKHTYGHYVRRHTHVYFAYGEKRKKGFQVTISQLTPETTVRKMAFHRQVLNNDDLNIGRCDGWVSEVFNGTVATQLMEH
ncbi:hypothetical protein J6590_083724 [Homalodisca vitripennis]|nr:hypothetical protein J6590_083724 [Homalodisca vitripennis]